jgi:hypothetical protein
MLSWPIQPLAAGPAVLLELQLVQTGNSTLARWLFLNLLSEDNLMDSSTLPAPQRK